MNTFLPYPDFTASARALDYRRLGKQRIEAKQIYETLAGFKKGWRHHPAVKMWKGCAYQLLVYGSVMCDEWRRRGYVDNLGLWFWLARQQEMIQPLAIWNTKPAWLGDPLFHASHRSNLLRKDSGWYGQFGWTEAPDMRYVWPCVQEVF